MPVIDISALILKGLIGAIPAADIPGRLYFATDEGKIYRDNGVTWDEVIAPGDMTKAIYDPGDDGVVDVAAAVDVSGIGGLVEGDLIVTGVSDIPEPLSPGSEGDILTVVSGVPEWAAPSPAAGLTGGFAINIGNGVDVITAGVAAAFRIPFACTLDAWSLLSVDNTTGDIQLDVWKDTHANAPPDNADSITNGHEPQFSAATKAEDTDISDWSDVTVDAGDWIVINVDSSATVTLVALVLTYTRS